MLYMHLRYTIGLICLHVSAISSGKKYTFWRRKILVRLHLAPFTVQLLLAFSAWVEPCNIFCCIQMGQIHLLFQPLPANCFNLTWFGNAFFAFSPIRWVAPDLGVFYFFIPPFLWSRTLRSLVFSIQSETSALWRGLLKGYYEIRLCLPGRLHSHQPHIIQVQ